MGLHVTVCSSIISIIIYDFDKIFVIYFHCMCAAIPYMYILCSLQYAELLFSRDLRFLMEPYFFFTCRHIERYTCYNQVNPVLICVRTHHVIITYPEYYSAHSFAGIFTPIYRDSRMHMRNVDKKWWPELHDSSLASADPAGHDVNYTTYCVSILLEIVFVQSFLLSIFFSFISGYLLPAFIIVFMYSLLLYLLSFFL
jgi:hypothetical protein